jgi:hypothetical protein
MKDGIQVHGAWTIVVRNPDGSVASRHQFQNALDPDGATYLTLLLARQRTKPDALRLALLSSSGSAPCTNGVGGRFPCVMSEPREAQTAFDSYAVRTLAVSVSASGQLTLTGSVKTTFGGSIGEVMTELRSSNQVLAVFTRHLITSPIAVLADQTIDVTVVISFS